MRLFCSSCGVENKIDDAKCKSCNAKLARPSEPIQGEIVGDAEGDAGLGTPMSILLGIACLLYIFNPTMGIFEFIPDNLPVIGNLDEATATAGLLLALTNLGLIPWVKKK